MDSLFENSYDDLSPEEADRIMEGNDREEAMRNIHHKLNFIEQGDFISNMTPVEYLIDNWIQEGGLHQLFGDSGSYKSFHVIAMCEAIACEDIETWAGKKVNHGEVIYFAGEGLQGLKKRIAGFCLQNNINPKDIPLHICADPFAVDDKNPEYGVDNVIANIKANYPNVKLVVFDTLNRFMSGEENSASDMGKFIRACSKIIHEIGCAVLIIHHTGLAHENKGRGRGSGALYGALDIEIQCVKAGMTSTLIQTKNKEAKKDNPLSFNMLEVEIPGVRNKQGIPVRTTTLVPVFNAEATEELANALPETTTPKVSKNYKRGIYTFRATAVRYGRLTSNDSKLESYIDVTLDEWRAVSYEILDGDKDSKRNKFNKAKATLVEDSEAPIITHYEQNGITYYRLTRNRETTNQDILAIFKAVIQREEEKKQSTEKNTAGGGEDTTRNIFGASE